MVTFEGLCDLVAKHGHIGCYLISYNEAFCHALMNIRDGHGNIPRREKKSIYAVFTQHSGAAPS